LFNICPQRCRSGVFLPRELGAAGRKKPAQRGGQGLHSKTKRLILNEIDFAKLRIASDLIIAKANQYLYNRFEYDRQIVG